MELSCRETELWAAALSGDGEAFASVFDLHRDRVYLHALRLVANAHDAEDVTAGAFLELWRRRKSVRLVEGSTLAWLLVTATNLSRNTARSLRRYRAFLASLPRSGLARGAGEAAVERIEEAATAERLREALGSLAAPDSALIALTAFEGHHKPRPRPRRGDRRLAQPYLPERRHFLLPRWLHHELLSRRPAPAGALPPGQRGGPPGPRPARRDHQDEAWCLVGAASCLCEPGGKPLGDQPTHVARPTGS